MFGTVGGFLTDNGGKFANKEFLNMCEALNINILTTNAESPWSNGLVLVERHNKTMAEILHKVVEDRTINIDITLAWSRTAMDSVPTSWHWVPTWCSLAPSPIVHPLLHTKL